MRELLRRRIGVVVIVVVLFVLVLGRRIASLAVDLWWYDAVGYREVFTTVLWTRLGTGLIAAVLLGVLVAVNLHIARKMRPLFLPETPQQAQVERYRELADPYLPWIIAGISVLFATSSGFALSTEWETVMLWRNGVDVGTTDPQFARDIGYFLFDLPMWSMLQDWLLTALVLTTMLTVGAHYLLGGIRPENPGDKVLPNVKAHLSGLFALVLAVWAWGYYLERFLLSYSPRGTVTGASYTDVTAELRALEILLVMSVLSIGLVLYNIRKRGFLLPGSAVGLLLVGSIFLQGAYPAAIQRLQVEPQELTREAPYIQRNLDATRVAYGLDEVELQPFEVANDLNVDQVAENQATLVNIRLWDDAILATTYAELQALRPYYRFNDVDVDRYVIDGQLRQVMLSTRDLRQEDLPAAAQNWQNQTLTYTHGFGVVASQVNTATEDGQPVFIARDIPPTGSEELIAEDAPGIYYGDEGSPTYNIVNTDQEELDYEEPTSQQQVTTQYNGRGGVLLSSFARRVAFALEFGDTNILLSNLITDDSKLLRLRDVADRVSAVAPYLTLDEDPYPVVIDGRVQWLQDAYTVSRWYPYAEYGVLAAEGGAQPVNYVRNSVKAVVDAYDGTVSLYAVDTTDPLLQAWSAAFPTSYQPMSAMQDGLEEHFRYPQDMFELQAKIYAEYHIPGVNAFFSKADEWDIPPDAAAVQNNSTTTAAPELDPYYLLMRLPGEVDEEFVLIQPYLASNRPNMVAWLAARSDPEHYGELYAVQFPSDSEVLGMAQAQTRIEQEEEISTYTTLLSQQGSQVIRGNMIVLPIERSILYVEPLFIQGGQSKIPELARVVVVMGNRVVFEETLAEAIATLVGGTVPSQPTVGEPSTPSTPDVEADPELLQRSLKAFADAQRALAGGDLGEYQRLIGEAQRLIEAALAGRTAADVAAEEAAAAFAEAAAAGTGTDAGTDSATDAPSDDGTGGASEPPA